MKRLLIALLLLTANVSAQDGVRSRWGLSGHVGTAVPLVFITEPTTSGATTVVDTALPLRGTAQSTSASPIVGVTWICLTCSTTAGTMTLNGLNWESAGGVGAATVLQETFNGPNSIDLALVPGWSEEKNTGTGINYLERNSAGYAKVNSSMANGTLIYKATPSPAITSTNYDVSVTVTQATGDGDDGAAIVFGYVDASNYCAAMWYGSGAATDLYLTKTVAGTSSSFGTPVNANPATNDVFSVEVRGSTLTVKQNGTPRIATALGTDCDNGNGVGLGLGSFRGVAGDDASTAWRFDDFTVVDQDAAAGAINVALGLNTITVEACDGVTPTPNCSTTEIKVTRETADSVSPEVIINAPTSGANYPTSTAALPPVTGTVTDNIAATTCTLTSGTTTPTSQPCTLSGSGGSKTFSCPSVALASGVNTITVTCADALTNPDAANFIATYTPGDVTAPNVTITTDGGSGVGANFTTTSPTGPIGGTCTDAVGCTLILPTCDVCSLSAVSGLGNWSLTATWAPGANVVTVGGRDQALNEDLTPDTITVTYNQPLVLVTTGFTVVEDAALNAAQCMTATGGSGTKTWSKVSGTYPAGVSLNTSTGCFTGTPTTAESQSLVMRVTDSSGSDDETVVFTVQAVGSGPHAYYESLRANPACFKAYSLRPLAGSTTPVGTTRGVADCTNHRYASQIPNGTTYPTYNYVTYPTVAVDTDVEKQDALKVVIPAFVEGDFYLADSNGSTGRPVLTQDIDITQTTFTMNWDGIGHENQQGMLVGSEVMQQTGWNSATNTMTVIRGAFGTPKASHLSGTDVRRSGNGVHDGTRRLFINTDGSVSATYLFTWDIYWTSDYRNTGLTSHKMFQISSWDTNAQMIEFKPLYSGGSNIDYSSTTDVASQSVRWYVQSLTPGYLGEPGEPFRDENNAVTNGLLIKPSTWVRVWMLVEANAETDATKFVNTGQTLVTPGGIDASTTQITMSHDLGGPTASYIGGPLRTNTSNPFTVGPPSSVMEGANQTHPGRRIRIGSEIMTIVSCSVCTGNTRTLTVRRNQDGTSAATHAEGAAIQAIEDYVTVWVADENNNARMVVNRLSAFIPINRPTTATVSEAVAAKERGSMATWWIEFNTSTGQTTQQRVNQLSNARGGNLVTYQRNFIMLKDPASCTASDCSTYIGTKPIK